MSTSLPMLLPSQGSGSGDNTALPVNTTVGDSSQAFANVLGSHFQPEAIAGETEALPLLAMENTALLPLLSVSAVDGQNLPLDLSQAELTDGNGLPLSPELMWSGMLVVNDSAASGPQLYRLSADGQSLLPQQVDPNMRAQVSRAMNHFAPLDNAEMPEILNLTDHLSTSPGLKEQSMLFTATATGPANNTMAIQKFSEIFSPVALNSDIDHSTSLLSSNDQTIQGLQSLGLGQNNDAGSGRLPDVAQLHLAASPKSPAWAQGLGERVQWLVQQNMQGAEIRLNPPELGSMEVKVHMSSEHGTQIHFSSPNGTVREALEAAIPRLREMFADAGLSLGDVNVSHHSMAEQQQNGEQGEGQGRGGRASTVASEATEDSARGQAVSLISDGLVDMYV